MHGGNEEGPGNIGRACVGAAFAALIAWAFELAVLASRDVALSTSLIMRILGEFMLPVAPAAVIATLVAALVRVADSALSLRRLLLSGIAAVAAIPLGGALGQGEGVVRSGLSLPITAGVPILAAVATILAVSTIARMARARRGTPAFACLVSAIVVREASRRLYVGLYSEVHDAMAIVEASFLIAAASILAARVRPSTGMGLVLGCLGIGLLLAGSAPDADLRRIYAKDGFHSERLLRLRLRLQPLPEEQIGVDESLVDSVLRWREVASDWEVELESRCPERRRFNLLWITVDTLRADQVGCCQTSPNGDSLTPRIDALARRAVVFRRAYAQYPSTHFSFESMFTGRYPTATSLYREITKTALPGDDPDPTFFETARRNGMANAAAISFTDEWMNTPAFQRLLSAFDLRNHGRTGTDSTAGEHFANAAIASLDFLAGQRFSLWLHLFDPHHAYVRHPGLTRGDDRMSLYQGEVRYADREVGRVLDHLEELGLAEETVVVLTADHGESFGEHGGMYFHGTSLYDEQVRVPLLVSVPGIASGVRDELVELVDLYATLQQLLGFEERVATQGTSLAPLILDPARSSGEFPAFAFSELPDDVKESSVGNVAMLRENDLKVIRHDDRGFNECFDLAVDPREARDLGEERARALLKKLEGLRAWNRRFGRHGTVEQRREETIARATSLLANDDPFVRMSGIVLCSERDATELADLVADRALDDDEFDEIRYDALSLLVRWKSPKARGVIREHLAAANPVLVRGALIACEVLGANTRGEFASTIASLATSSPDAIVRREASIAAAADAASIADVVEGAGAHSLRLRALSALARALVADGGVTTNRLRGILHIAERLAPPQECAAALLEAAWRVDRGLWSVTARRWTENRYLGPAVKRAVLEHLQEVPASAGRALAWRLLAGWDPEFHAMAKARLRESFDEETIAELARARIRFDGAQEAWASEDWAVAATEFEATSNALPRDSGQEELRLRAIHARLALGDFRGAAKALARVAEAVADWSDAERRVWPDVVDLLDRLVEYRLDDGPLEADEPIAVSQVEVVDPQCEVLSEARFTIRAIVHHGGRRTLLDGRWPRGGRLRIVWRRGAESSEVYGTDLPLAGALTPGESRAVRLEISAPKEPGEWKGRVIVYEHFGARFHHAETERADFAVTVHPAQSPPCERTFTGERLVASWRPGPRIEDWGSGARGGEGVIVGYAQEFSGPVLAFDGRPRVLRIDLAVRSVLPGSDVATLILTPEDSAETIRSSVSVTPDGRFRTIDFPVRVSAGKYRPKLILCSRQALVRCGSIEIR